ncbi:hypothetical protein B0H17DRAFT_958236, partial [Mycena rosella]
FGFLDPTEVIRATHLLPGFHYGRTSSLLPRSIARRLEDKDEDWVYYYVNFFVDRDTFMRYFENAIGHRKTRSAYNESKALDEENTDMDVDSSGMDNGNEAGDAAGTKGDDDTDSDTSDIEEEQQLEGEEELEEEEDTAVIGHNDDEILDAIGYDEL